MILRLLLIHIFLLSYLTGAHALEITFIKSTATDSSTVRLDDIVNFDEQSELARALGNQIVAQAPPPGEQIFLRSIKIKNRLVSQHNIPASTIWRGSPVVSVKRNGITVGSDDILNYITDFLREHQGSMPEAAISFHPNSLPLPFHLPVGDLSCEVIPSDPSILGSSRFSLIFRINNRVVKNMSIRGKLEALAEVVVASKSVKKGTVLQPHHLKTQFVDLGKVSNPGYEIDSFVGMRLKRSLRTGAVLKTALVEPLPIVRRGEKVKIYVNTGQMLLTATGLAHANGIKGQVIRVQNINSRKVLFCRVTAPGLVEVLL